jgi:DNA polymerase II small subunit
VYGRKTPIAAGRQDRLIIDPVPEILHTGHVHVSGITTYRGVLGINAGTWQSQTSFQKQMNVYPTPAEAVVVDLQTLRPEIKAFG